MSAASDDFENDLLLLLYNNTAIANIGDATGIRSSSAAGSLYVSLHTADPGETGKQNTSETAYTGYARVAVARSSAGWTVSGSNVTNAAQILFGSCTASPGSAIAYWAVGYETGTGATKFVLRGTCTLTMAVGVQPKFEIGALTNTVA